MRVACGASRDEPTGGGVWEPPMDLAGPMRGGAILLALVDTVLLAVIGVFAWWREDPVFWQNSGGWPVGLRAFVRVGFLPLLILHLGLLLWLTWLGLRSLLRRGVSLLLLGALPPLWVGTLAVVAWLLVNNVLNLLEGRPFHWHPG
ncbi:MAG: hypothetical protein KDM81_10555 [Verrucomicrobiae bacterium]|nr:hypothetical protein [Verrucomicrobiae bacterium]MCP5520294.1 hypothetical protein [Verrucomicrobiales bacterium]